jgi:peptidoglycan hydrolase-like protein with peptidoglycan-binding domain
MQLTRAKTSGIRVRASSPMLRRPTAAPSPAPRGQYLRSPCPCGGGCPRCEPQAAPAPSAKLSVLKSPERPEVVVDPNTALETPEFAKNATLVAVMAGKRYLSYGAYGDAVRLVQEALQSSEPRRPTTPAKRLPKFGVDGNFRDETKAAVEDFQSEYGLAVDGIVGPQTLYWLDKTFKDYLGRPGAEPDHKLPGRFPGEIKSSLQKPSAFDLKMKVDSPVAADATISPKISAGVTFTASFAGPDGKVFFVQNIRRTERKVHWQRSTGCTSDCEQARAYVGKAQGLDTSLPYNSLPSKVTATSQTMTTGDQPAATAEKDHNPKGDFQAGDVVHVFAHDQFRMFLAFGPADPRFDFSEFDALGFVDWEWKGKVRFAFNGTTWSVGAVQSRQDPVANAMIPSRALIFLGPLYTGEEIDRNLRSERTKINEKPDVW